MNFFGHAAVAIWHVGEGPAVDGDDLAALALGAMLPDFAGMCGARLGAIADAAIARGVALHHRTDAAFHRLDAFTALCRASEQALRDAGVRRGPARGIAHIGVEIVLDRAVLDDAAVRAAYLDALACAAPAYRGGAIGWREPGGELRFERLRTRLHAYGVPDDYRDLAAVAHRVDRALAGRPLLALDDGDRAALGRVLPAIATAVDGAAAAIFMAMRAATQAPDA